MIINEEKDDYGEWGDKDEYGDYEGYGKEGDEEWADEQKGPTNLPLMYGLFSVLNTAIPVGSFLYKYETSDFFTSSWQNRMFSIAAAGGVLSWGPILLFWLINATSGGSAGLFYAAANLGWYSNVITFVATIVAGV